MGMNSGQRQSLKGRGRVGCIIWTAILVVLVVLGIIIFPSPSIWKLLSSGIVSVLGVLWGILVWFFSTGSGPVASTIANIAQTSDWGPITSISLRSEQWLNTWLARRVRKELEELTDIKGSFRIRKPLVKNKRGFFQPGRVT